MPGAVKVVKQDPNYPVDLAALVKSGQIGAKDIVVVYPDLGNLFNFKDLSVSDMIGAVRDGLEFLRGVVATLARHEGSSVASAVYRERLRSVLTGARWWLPAAAAASSDETT